MATNTNIGTYDNPYISAVPLQNKREIWRKLIDLQQDDEWVAMMYEMGRTKTASNIYHFDSFYNDPKFIVIDTTGATVTGSGTATITVTNLTAGNNNYTKTTDTILLPNGKVALVKTLTTTTLSNDTFTAQSVDGSNLTLVAGDRFVVNGSAMEEGSDTPADMRFNISSVRNNIQIFSQAWKITDVQAGNQVEVYVNDQPYVLPRAAIDAMQKLHGQLTQTYWTGIASPTLFEDQSPALTGPNGKGVQTTRGMDSYITNYGIQPAVSSPGTVQTTDLQDICDRLTAVKAPQDYMLVGGNSPKTTMDIYLKNLGSSGAQSVRMMNGAGKELDFEAERFSFGNYNFHLMSNKFLSNPQTVNYIASGGSKLNIARSLYMLPLGNCPVYGGENGGSGGTQPYWQMRFCPFGPGAVSGVMTKENGQIYEFVDGGLAGIGTSAYRNTRYYTQMGVEMFKSQVFGRWLVN